MLENVQDLVDSFVYSSSASPMNDSSTPKWLWTLTKLWGKHTWNKNLPEFQTVFESSSMNEIEDSQKTIQHDKYDANNKLWARYYPLTQSR